MSPGQKFLGGFSDPTSSPGFAPLVSRGPRTEEQMRAELEALHQKEEAQRVVSQGVPKRTEGSISVGELRRVRGWLETHSYDRPSSARHELAQIAKDLGVAEASVQKCLARLQDDYDHASSKGKMSFK